MQVAPQLLPRYLKPEMHFQQTTDGDDGDAPSQQGWREGWKKWIFLEDTYYTDTTKKSPTKMCSAQQQLQVEV